MRNIWLISLFIAAFACGVAYWGLSELNPELPGKIPLWAWAIWAAFAGGTAYNQALANESHKRRLQSGSGE